MQPKSLCRRKGLEYFTRPFLRYAAIFVVLKPSLVTILAL